MQNQDPLVSICISAFNAEKYISNTLDSLLHQSYENIEIIIVNDGSTDNTLAILNKISDPRVKIIDKHNQGQGISLNIAYNYANGTLIKFMDADDLISGDFIKNQVIALDNNPNAIATSSWGRFYNNDVSTFKLNTESVWRNMDSFSWLIESLNSRQNMMQCAIFLIPRNILERSGLWNENLNLIIDFEFFIRVLLHSKEIKFTENAILYYNSGIANSVSNYKTNKAYESAFLAISLGTQHLINYQDNAITRKIAADNFQNLMYQVYPQHLKLYKQCKIEINKNGGSDYPYLVGGVSKFVYNLFGWKVVNLIKYILKKLKSLIYNLSYF